MAMRLSSNSLQASERFTAIQNYEVDVLMHNTTWTLSRDTENEIIFAPPNFMMGKGVMVKVRAASSESEQANRNQHPPQIVGRCTSRIPISASHCQQSQSAQTSTPAPPQYPVADAITSLVDLDRMTICVLEGAGLDNFDLALRELEVEYLPLTANNIEQLFADYQSDKCDAISLEKSQLAAWRSQQPTPETHKILNPVMSKEPFSAVTINSDDRWHDVVSWVIYATFMLKSWASINQTTPFSKILLTPKLPSF
jgi:general L-amino acid transport system substrate-binding protein